MVVAVEGGFAQITVPSGNVLYVDKDWVVRQARTTRGDLIATQGEGTFTQIGQKDMDVPAQVGKQWMFTYQSQPSAGTGSMVNYLLRYTVVACVVLGRTVQNTAAHVTCCHVGRSRVYQWLPGQDSNPPQADFGCGLNLEPNG